MTWKRWTIVGLLVALGGVLALPGDGGPARASADAGGSDWSFYVFDKPGTPSKTGKAAGRISTPLLAAESSLIAFRAFDASGTQEGGGSDNRFTVLGLVVTSPKLDHLYSWTAFSDVGAPSFTAEVDLGALGFAAGYAEGTVKLKMFGDLNWTCDQSVAARDFVGGQWLTSWPPAYSPPGADATISYKKSKDVKGLMGMDRQKGGDDHVQVRFLSRISGQVMAHCQWGLDKRHASASLNLSASVRVSLWGYTQCPAPEEGERPPKKAGAWMYVSLSEVEIEFTETEQKHEKVPFPPDETEKGNHDGDDFTSDDW